VPEARSTDPDTSHQAAASVDTRNTIRAVWDVLDAIGPSTDVDLIRAYGLLADDGTIPRQSESGIRTRRHELVRIGRVEDTGTRKKLDTGRSAIVWAAVN
jgi:hypothetical protein